jgi:hypothetical protein
MKLVAQQGISILHVGIDILVTLRRKYVFPKWRKFTEKSVGRRSITVNKPIRGYND